MAAVSSFVLPICLLTYTVGNSCFMEAYIVVSLAVFEDVGHVGIIMEFLVEVKTLVSSAE